MSFNLLIVLSTLSTNLGHWWSPIMLFNSTSSSWQSLMMKGGWKLSHNQCFFVQYCKWFKSICTKYIYIKYRKVFHLKSCMCCAIYKLAHDVNFLTWVNSLKLENQLFSFVLNEFVYVINSIYNGLISWLEQKVMAIVTKEF